MRDRRAHLLARARLLRAEAAELAMVQPWDFPTCRRHHALCLRATAAEVLAGGNRQLARAWLASAIRNEKEANI